MAARPDSTGATITATAGDYTGAADNNPTITLFDELWGYTSERSRRLWDEMIPVPTRKVSVRLTTTYAGYGITSPSRPGRRPNGREQMRSTPRPNASLRMIENRWVTSESNFVELD